VLGSTHHPPFSLTLIVMFLGLGRSRKATLAVPEEGEGDFESLVLHYQHVTSLRCILKYMSAQRDRDDVDGNESYIRHIRSTLPNKITDTARELVSPMQGTYIIIEDLA